MEKENLKKNIILDGEEDINFIVEGFNKTVESTNRKDRIFHIIFLIFCYVCLTFFAFIMMIPFYWMILSSLKTEVIGTQFVGLSNDFFIALDQIAWENYKIIFDPEIFDFFKYLTNTIIVAIISTLGTLFITIFASFAFARMQFKGRDLTFYVYLATMMIPSELFVITNYIQVYRFNLLDSQWGVYFAIMLPFFVNVFYIYLLNENFKQIPNELYLAAKIDGKSDWKYLWKVMVPIASPTLITITILKIISTWNAYAWPQVATIGNTDYTLISVAIRNRDLANFVYSKGDIQFALQSLQMAATVVITFPLVLLFIIFRKFIMNGTSRTGIKG